MYVQKHQNFSSFDIEIDGEDLGNYSMNGSSVGDDQQLLFEKMDLEDTEHTITCTIVARDGRIQSNLDYLEVFSPSDAVDKTALQDAIGACAGMKEKDYTEDTWAGFESVYTEAVAAMTALIRQKKMRLRWQRSWMRPGRRWKKLRRRSRQCLMARKYLRQGSEQSP